MNNCIENILNGQYKYLFWFCILIVVIYIPSVYFWFVNKQKKVNTYLRENPDAVKMYIERTKLNDLLTVCSINGKKPVMFSQKVKYGYYLLPGENIIDVMYQWTTVSITSFSGYEDHIAENKKLRLTIETNREYSLYYDHTLEEYVFAEKQK